MASAAGRRAPITLYSQPECVHSHRARFVMAEKGVTAFDVVELRPGATSEDLLALNPDNSVPTFVDRDVVISESRIIIEYLDERYPHPPLMPIDPASRARYRQALHRLERDLYELADELEVGSPAHARKARAGLRDHLALLATDLSGRPYMGDTFSLVDRTFAPILWRLERYRVELPERASRRLADYGERLFQRPAFRESLTAAEADLAHN